MLWYKAWLETRWRFIGGAALLAASALSTVAFYPEVLRLLPAASSVELQGELGRRVAESAELSRTYRGYVWSQAFRQNLPQLWTILAVVLGSGGLLAQMSGGGTLFTLSLPVSRAWLVGVRAITVVAELFTLSLLTVAIVVLASPSVGQAYALGDAVVHGLCMFVGSLVFFSLAFWLSTLFADIWRPMILALCVAFGLGLLEQFGTWGVYRVMSGESYFRGFGVPWVGLISIVGVSLALLYAATRNVVGQDF